MDYFEKNFGIIFCALYYYQRILNVKSNTTNKYIYVLYTIGLSLISTLIDNKLGFLTIPVLIVLTYLFLYIITKKKVIFKILFISYAFSYSWFVISTFIVGMFVFVVSNNIFINYSQIVCTIIQLCIMQIPFVFKRNKSNFIVWNKTNYFIPVFSVSVFVICLSMNINSAIPNYYYLGMALIVLMLAVVLFVYRRTAITRHYLERLSLRNIDSLNAELVEKTNYIKELEEDKARIEKLNHKNYKLVPAMEGAVMHYLDGVKSFVEANADNPAFAEFAAAKETDMAGFIDEGNRLLGELNKMLAEWEEIVHNDDIDGKKDLPACGVTRVDYILSYMYERSLKENFVLKVDVDSELTGLTEKIITDEDLGTLIADLIENAIIATKHNNGKDILVRLGMMKKEYTIEVYDSGIPFDKEVLAKYGYEQITTHGDESGSGIGMMQTYEILSKCGASLFIDEFAEGEGMYTKRISVVFNKKHQYVLYTKRSDEEVAYLKKRSDLMIVRK